MLGRGAYKRTLRELAELAPKREVEAVLSALADRGGRLPTAVDPLRLRFTAALTLASLNVSGDTVETGVFKGGTTLIALGLGSMGCMHRCTTRGRPAGPATPSLRLCAGRR